MWSAADRDARCERFNSTRNGNARYWMACAICTQNNALGSRASTAYQEKIASQATSARTGGMLPVRRHILAIPIAPSPNATAVPALTTTYSDRIIAGFTSCVYKNHV